MSGSGIFLAAPHQLILLLGTDSSRRVEARSPADGRLQWSRLGTELSRWLGVRADQPLWIMSGGASETGPFLNLRTNAGGSAWSSWIVTLNPTSGEPLWKWGSTYLDNTLSDGSSIFTYEDLWQHRLIGLDGRGQERFTLLSSERPMAAFDTSLLTGFRAVVRDGSSGSPLESLTHLFAWESLAIGQNRIYIPDWNRDCSRSLRSQELNSGGLAPPLGLPPRDWRPSLGGCIVDPLLTSRGSIVASTGGDSWSTGQPALYEMNLERGEVLGCRLPVRPRGRAAFAAERWVAWDGTKVSAFALPGISPAPSGWICSGGSPGRANRPARGALGSAQP